MEPIVSIIVPVYNSGKYFEDCLHSILCQTEQNFELIIVDDGSIDNSLTIAKGMLADRSFTKIVSQCNSGVSSARNHGIKLSTGKYITFIDSDDLVEEDYLSKLVNVIENEDVDFVMSGITYFKGNGVVVRSEVLPSTKFSCKEPNDWFEIATMDLITSPVSKLYKASIIKNEQLFFDESKSLGEDRDFNVRYLSFVNNAESIHSSSYKYRRDVSNSLTRKYHKERFFNDIDYWNKLKGLLEHKSALKGNEKYVATRLFWFVVDDFSEKFKNEGLLSAIKDVKRSKYLFDHKFLVSHLDSIKAPDWMKLIIFLCYK